jgi:hypothetical protein
MLCRIPLIVASLIFSCSLWSQQKDSSLARLKIKKEEYGFMAGDIIISPNIGYPHITPALLKASIYAYNKLFPDGNLDFSLSSHGVYNIKAEYGLLENLGLGFAASYWDMSFKIQNNYTKDAVDFHDDVNVDISAKAFGIRGNYHLVDETESRWFDLYSGFTIGTTYYQKNIVFTSTNPDRQINDAIPKKLLNFHNGWSTYFSATLGARVYPVRYLGLNAELGWDRGAFFFVGVALKLKTKPIASMQD